MRPLAAVGLDDGRVVLKRGVTEFVLAGEDATNVAGAVAAAVRSGQSIAELLGELTEADRIAAVDVLQALAARRMLDPGGPDDFFDEFGAFGTAAAERLAVSEVVVRGTGVVAAALTTALESVGIGTTSTANRARPALVVATSDAGDEDALLAAGRAALDADVPFLPVWVHDMVGYAGPLTWPRETACLRCYQLRVDANEDDPAVRRALRSAPSPTGLLAPMGAVIAQIAAMEAAKAIGGFAPADVAGRSIEINLVSFRSTVRRVLKHPRCPDCAPGARRPAQTVLAGVQITD